MQNPKHGFVEKFMQNKRKETLWYNINNFWHWNSNCKTR